MALGRSECGVVGVVDKCSRLSGGEFLERGSREGQHLDIDAALVHGGESSVVEV